MDHNLLPNLIETIGYEGSDLFPLLNKSDKYHQVLDSYVNPPCNIYQYKIENNRIKKLPNRSNSVINHTAIPLKKQKA